MWPVETPDRKLIILPAGDPYPDTNGSSGVWCSSQPLRDMVLGPGRWQIVSTLRGVTVCLCGMAGWFHSLLSGWDSRRWPPMRGWWVAHSSAELAAALDDARVGRGRSVLVVGEAGMGKQQEKLLLDDSGTRHAL